MIKTLSKALTSSNFLRKARVIKTMFSLKNSKEILSLFQEHLPLLVIFSSGLTRVAPRLRHFHKFSQLLLRTYRHHGSLYTVKWLKACHTSIQRYISGNKFRSLRSIEPNLPLPRLINGLPYFIGSVDRSLIRQRHGPTVRMWLTVLSVYRVLDAPSKWNLATITDPYKGSEIYIDVLTHGVFTSLRHWRKTTGYFSHVSIEKLSAKSLRLSQKAGPNMAPSYAGAFADALSIKRYYPVLKSFRSYAELTSSTTILTLFETSLRMWDYWGKSSDSENILNTSKIPIEVDRIATPKGVKLVTHTDYAGYTDLYPGRLVGLKEPAGKLRIIAIVDVWTQSLLKPLHDSLFDILRKLPNDGTFDQNLSVKRSIEKAKASNQAYSVDLSSATDRLPIRLQEEILNLLFGNLLGTAWRNLLTRPFILREGRVVDNKLVTNQMDCHGQVVEYGTGQPMGCLSSWAMLAITHHMIVQQCARSVFQSLDWHDCYEILGDDLVIFNKEVYLEYLRVMAELNVETNPSKSLISESSATFEFAKRTVMDGIDVSGLSWQQFITTKGLKLKLNLIISLGERGLIWRDGLIERLITMNRHIKLKRTNSALTEEGSMSLMLSLLSYFAQRALISFECAIAYVVDPSKGEDIESLTQLPVKHTVHDLVSLFLQVSRPIDNDCPTDLLTVPNLKERLRVGESRIFTRLGTDIYTKIDEAIVRYNDSVHKVTELFMEELLRKHDLISSIPWDKREWYHYALDNLLRQMANSFLWGHSTHDVSDELVDFNESESSIPELSSILKFRDKAEGEMKKFSFLDHSKKGKELNIGPTSWLAVDLSRAERRIRAPNVLENLVSDEDKHLHAPGVGVWDVMMPSVKSK